MFIVGLALVAGIAFEAQASRCEYHQWTPCKDEMGDRVPSSKCEYFQWKWNRCVAEKPAPVAAAPKKLFLKGIQFDTGSARIKPASYEILERNMEALQKAEHITIVGHTDDRGNDASNMKLSEARAASVKNYYVEKGISDSKMTTEGRGETQPIADNSTEAGRAENRRIEIDIR